MIEKKDIPAAEKACEDPNENGAVRELKAAREARGLSLQDVFSSTRVSVVNLQAVENEDYDHLPPPVYARNFIRKYARAIGVDEKPLLERYERHLDRLKPLREEAEVQKPWPEDGRRYRFLFLSLAAVIAAGILVYAIFLYDQSGRPPAPASPVEPTAAQVTPPVQEAPAPAVEPAAAPPAKAAPAVEPAPPVQGATPSRETAATVPAPAVRDTSPAATSSTRMHQLTIEARELTWVRIAEDRNPPYQAMLKPGDKIERMAADYFMLDVGNAGGINVTFDGKNLDSLGKRGQIVHIRLPEKSPE